MLFIAIRQMLARKKQTFFTLVGIVLGALAYVIISGVLLGLREYLVDQLINNDAQIKISSQVKIIHPTDLDSIMFQKNEIPNWLVAPAGRRDSSQIENQAGWLKTIARDSDVEAYSPQLHIKVFYRKGKIVESGKMIGVNAKLHTNVVKIQTNMIKGNFKDISQSGNRMIIGEGMRLLLGATLYDTVYIESITGRSVPFKIVGIFQMGNKAIDDAVSYINLTDAQSFNRTPNRLSDIAVRMKDVRKSKEQAEKWAKDANVKVQSWEEINATFISLFKMQDTIRYALVTTILLVASFGIYNILNIVITQKRREIAILRSIGFEPRDILRIFLLQGLILGIMGGLIGILIGIIVSNRLESVSFNNPLMQTKSGLMVISYNPMIYLQAFLLAFIATLIASIIPARSASKLSPIEIIRGE